MRDAEKTAGSAADDKQISSSSSAVISEAAEKTDLENPPVLPTFETPDTIPDGGYGWVVVATVFFINSSTWGVNSVCTPIPSQSILELGSLTFPRHTVSS